MTGAFTVALVGVLLQGGAPGSPQAAVDDLLAVDREFARKAETTDVVRGLTAMFAADVIVPGPPARLYRGLDEVTAFLRSSPDADARARWTPIRAGLSADGLHGFTFGVMTLTRADGGRVPLKYMAYWIKGAGGWRVAGYKRARRPEGEATTDPMPPLLPGAFVPPTRDPARLEQHRVSLVAAEQAFSDEAQRIGLGPAFAAYGSATAVNMGGPSNPSFVVGPEAIARLVGAGAPGAASPVHWASAVAIVAGSGDLGISFGFIRPHAPAADGSPAPGQPFFTIWHRPSPGGAWRYIAE